MLEFESYAARNQTPNTPAVSLLYAAAAQGAHITREGIEARWARHAAMARAMQAWLADARIVRKFATFGPGELPHGRAYTNHAYELESPGARDEWDHTVVGDGDDAGLVFRYRWVPLDPEPTLWGTSDPVVAKL